MKIGTGPAPLFPLVVLFTGIILTGSLRGGDNPGSLMLSLSNDVFSGTDRAFTGGFRLVWLSQDITDVQRHAWLRWLPRVKKPDRRTAISLSFGQNILTPDDLDASELIRDDRPYAGYLFLGLAIHSRNEKELENLEFDLGLVGPHAFAQDVQGALHNWFRGTKPAGWHNQLKDELTLQLLYEYRRKVVHEVLKRGFNFDLIPHVGGAVGNVYTFINTGFQVRWGLNLPDDFGASATRPGGDSGVSLTGRGYRSPPGRFGFQVFMLLEGKAVFRDIFLDGNTIRDSHKVQKNPLTAALLLGASMKMGRFLLGYTHVFWTRHFKIEKREQIFGVFSLTFLY